MLDGARAGFRRARAGRCMTSRTTIRRYPGWIDDNLSIHAKIADDASGRHIVAYRATVRDDPRPSPRR
jgi:hypothetical protein